MSKQRKNQNAEQRAIIEEHQRKIKQDLMRDSAELKRLLNTRAGSLLAKGKPFVVVAIDEPYYAEVYRMIRAEEKRKGSWTQGDEAAYWNAMSCWADGEWVKRRDGGGKK